MKVIGEYLEPICVGFLHNPAINPMDERTKAYSLWAGIAFLTTQPVLSRELEPKGGFQGGLAFVNTE